MRSFRRRLCPLPRFLPCERLGSISGTLLFLAFALLSPVPCRAQTEDPLKQHYQAANQFARAGDRAHASEEYRAFLAEALHRIANGKADAGSFDSAAPMFEEAIALSPAHRSVKFDYAKACLDDDNLPKAKSLAEPLAKSPEATPETKLLFGRVLFHLGEFASAKDELEQVFAEKPEFNTGYLLGKTYLLLHEEQQARQLFNGMAQKFGDTFQTHVYFGRAYSETDYRQQALEEFRRAMDKDDRAPDVHYYLGLTYLGHNESAGYAQAVPEFRAELHRNHDFRSHYMLGYIALKQRDLKQAESELLNATGLEPTDLQSLLLLAEVYDDQNRAGEAERVLRKAISLAANHAQNEGQVSRAHYLLGRLLYKTGRPQEAMLEMKTVADIQRRLGPSSTQTADARTKEAQDQTRSAAQSIPPEKLKQLEQFTNALRPAIADAYNNLGVISASDSDLPSALKYFRSASAWDPSLEGLDRNLGRGAFLAGQFDQAAPPLSRYLQQHPEDNSARSILGITWFRLGEYRKAVDVLTPIASVIQSNPDLANAYNVSRSKIGKE